MATYNKAQWRDSFEGKLSLLRPHLTPRLLDSPSLTAWQAPGTKGDDPVKAAKTVSAQMDAQAGKPK